MFAPDFPNDKATIYVLSDIPHAESEFGIDDDLLLPDETWLELGYDSIKILSLEYNYEIVTDSFLMNSSDTLVSYGKVTVDIDYL